MRSLRARLSQELVHDCRNLLIGEVVPDRHQRNRVSVHGTGAAKVTRENGVDHLVGRHAARAVDERRKQAAIGIGILPVAAVAVP